MRTKSDGGAEGAPGEKRRGKKVPLAHLTMNTGDMRMSPRSEVSDETIRALDALIKGGGKIPGIDATCAIERGEIAGQLTFLLRDTTGVLLVGGLVWEAARSAPMWRAMLHLAQGQAAQTGETLPPLTEPDHLPWLAVSLAAPAVMLEPETLMMMGDFERCLGWTLLAEEGLGGL